MSLIPLAVITLGTYGHSSTTMEDFVRRYSTDRDSIERYYAVPLSELGLKRREEHERATLDELKSINFDSLDRDGQVDYVLLRNFCEAGLRDDTTSSEKFKKVKSILPFANQIVKWEEDRWSLQPLDPEVSAQQLSEMNDQVKGLQDGLKSDGTNKPSSADALRASQYLSGLRDTLRRWFEHYDGYKPLFSWWCKTPYAALSKSLEGYEKTLKEDIAGQKGEDSDPLIGDPIGRDRLNNDLKREMIDYSPEELIEIAEKEYAWCKVEMLKASHEMGCGDDWRRAIELTKQDHVKPGEQDDLIMEQGREAVKFVEDNDLVTLEPLCKETWRVNMLTADQQRNWPFAFYGGQHMATSYPVPEMDNTTKQMSMRGNNRHFMRAVTYHELIPGHHLQIYMSERYRPYRSLFSTPFFIEGWALHWEMLMWDLNFAKSAEDKVGMLFWRMHRCARIVVSLKFHLGEMSPQQMIDYLVDNVGHERWTATSEVRRYVGDMYSPLYQCAYMIGGLQLRSLYKELVPKKMTSKEFHDRVLHLGPIPMDMVRASMTNMKLERGTVGGKFVRQSFDSP